MFVFINIYILYGVHISYYFLKKQKWFISGLRIKVIYSIQPSLFLYEAIVCHDFSVVGWKVLLSKAVP